jgi:succinate dehydrogenase/fumarate reductase flavoprotein subunit
MRELNRDVVIVGCGAAGLTAALAALQNGAKVIVLERSTVEDRGGNTRVRSGRGRWLLRTAPSKRVSLAARHASTCPSTTLIAVG